VPRVSIIPITELIDVSAIADMLTLITKQTSPKTLSPIGELDTDFAVSKAIDYLKHNAPEAIEGAAGDETTYKVATRLRDFGLSEPAAFEILSEHWNEAGKAIPPWDPNDLLDKVKNAFNYATGAWGGMSGVNEFDDVSDFLEHKRTNGGTYGEWITPFDPTAIPKRAWVLGHFLAKGYLTGLVAPPGAGKTTLELEMAVALATGRDDIVGMPVIGRHRVFLWNQEDELDELKRRLAAVMRAFNVTFDDLTIDGSPALLIGSGADNALMMARRGSSAIVAAPAALELIQTFLDSDISVAMFDPFVELHPAEENSNVEISQVGRIFRKIAVEARCAVLIVHHTRKPATSDSTSHAGNMDSARGAGSLVGVTRMGGTLYTIDDKTAEQYGVDEDDRHRYVRFDDGKNNMALPNAEPIFYRREGVNIGTIDDPEEVGVLRPVGLSRKKPATEQRAEDLADAIVETMAGADTMPVIDVARALIVSDPLYADAKIESLSRAIKRSVQEGRVGTIVIENRAHPEHKKRCLTLIVLPVEKDGGQVAGQPDKLSAGQTDNHDIGLSARTKSSNETSS